VIHALSPKEIERKQGAAALLAQVPLLIDDRKPSPVDLIDPKKAREAADRLWKEIVRLENAAADQPSKPRGR